MTRGKKKVSISTVLPIELSDTTVRRSSYKGGRLKDKLQTAPFMGWDGEGYTDNSGIHHYMLFGNSSGDYVAGESLTYKECFPLLLKHGTDHNNVVFGGDYDIIMMVRTMPHQVLDRLLHSKPVRYQGYRMLWYRKKYFQLSYGEGSDRKSIILYDVHSFFGCSFVKACRQYLGDSPELDSMHTMKLRRGAFTLGETEVLSYWKSELDHLVRLMNLLRDLLLEAGIKPNGWYGPGAVASNLLASHQMKPHMGNTPASVTDVGERAYYGGRFEQFQVGKLENVIEYDIRSAYPAAIAQLPSLHNVNWVYETVWNGKFHPFALYNVSWDFNGIVKVHGKPRNGVNYTLPGPLPWRSDKGRIYYPLKGVRSWYWGVEAQNLTITENHSKTSYQVHGAWIPLYDPTPDRPFQWVTEMYETRAKMKAEGNPAQLAVKLGLNSLYGKLAQSKGSKQDKDGTTWRKATWHQILWAGWVTAYTRRQMFKAIWSAGFNGVALETDAIFTTKPLPNLPVGEGLGEWEMTVLPSMLHVHSGVYYALRDDGVWKLKSRGVESDQNKNADYWLDIFKKLPHQKVEVSLSFNRFGTDLRTSTFGNWYTFTTSTILPAMNSKRIHYAGNCHTCMSVLIRQAVLQEQCDRAEIPSFAEKSHGLTVPEPALSNDLCASTPYPFPWREDGCEAWPSEWSITEADRDMSVDWI